jgi:hypothetical protein
MLLDRWEDDDDDHEESVAFKHWYKTEGIYIEKKMQASNIIKISAYFNVSLEYAANAIEATDQVLEMAKQIFKNKPATKNVAPINDLDN